MNKPKVNDLDYIQFLIASPKTFTCTEAARVQPEKKNKACHDSLTRVLHRTDANSSDLWNESKSEVNKIEGVLVLDDTTIDKPYSKKIELVSYHWSGKHHDVVRGMNLITLLWSDGEKHIPCDFRLYNKEKDSLSKNDHFSSMLEEAFKRGFHPEYVLFDSWYNGLSNLKVIAEYNWYFLTRLKSNRLVNPDKKGNLPISKCEIDETGTIVHLKGFGMIKVFKIVSRNGNIEYWATNNLEMEELDRLKYSGFSWSIENYHRGLKQFCGVEKAQVRSEKAQRNHISFSIRAFLRLEVCFQKTGRTWFESKASIIRNALKEYLKNPIYTLANFSTA